MATQEPQEDFLPEWDTKAVVDAGVREGTIVQAGPVTRPSFQQKLVKNENQADAAMTFQQAVERVPSPQNPSRGTGDSEKDRYAATRLVAASGAPADKIYDLLLEKHDALANSPNVSQDIETEVTGMARETVEATVKTLAATLNEQDAAIVTAAYKELAAFYDETNRPWGFESVTNAQIMGLAALNSVEQSTQLQEKAYYDYAMALVGNDWNEVSRGRTVYDFAKSLVLTSTATSIANMAEEFTPGMMGEVWNTLEETGSAAMKLSIEGKGKEVYDNTVHAFWAQSPRNRLILFPEIQAEIKRVSEGNIFAYMTLIQPFAEKGAIEDLNFDYTVDQVSVLGFFPAKATGSAIKFAVKAAAAKKPIKILIDAGRVEHASHLINRALADKYPERAKKITGMSKNEVAASAHVLDMSPVMGEQIQGAARAAAEQLEKDILDKMGTIDQEFTKILSPEESLQRSYYDEAAKRARQREVLGYYNDGIDFARIVESSDTGFVVEVERGSKYAGMYDADSLRVANQVHEQHIADLHERAGQIREQIPGSIALRQATEANVGVADRARMTGNDPLRKGIKDKTKPKKPETRTIEEIADEEFGTDEEVIKIQDQIRDLKEKIKRNDKIINDLGKDPKIESERISYTMKQSGTYDATTIGSRALGNLSSPSQGVDKLFDQVGDATLGEFQEVQNLGRINNAVREVSRGLTSKQFKDIDHLLLHGDEMGEEMFSVSDLVSGVDTKWGRVKLDSTKSIAAYYARRRQAQWLHRIENQIQRRGLEHGGYKQMKIKLKDENGANVKMYGKESAVRNSIPEHVKRIYDHKVGKIVDVDDALRKRLNEQSDWAVMEFRSSHKFGDEGIRYGVVRPDVDMKPIDGQVLNYRPGYVPRQRPNVFYVAAREVPWVQDGVKTKRWITEGFFDNLDEATKFKAQQKEGTWQVLPDKKYRENNPDFDSEFDGLNFGGMFTGERTDRAILMGLDGKEAHRASAYYSFQMYSNHIANRVAMNELKMNLVGRFQNTYGQHLTNPGNWRSPLKAEALNHIPLRDAIEAQRTYINDLIRMPDKFQNWWTSKMRGIAELMEPKDADGWFKSGIKKGMPRQWVMDFASRDPTEFVRAAAFHQFLGVFNPAQVLIQGMGFATAAAAYPGKAMKLLPKNMALRIAYLGKDSPEKIRIAAEAVGMDGDELNSIVKEIERIGLFDSLKTSADYNASVQGVSMSADALRRVLDSGLFFFREGEQMARGYGYLLARDLFMKNRKSKLPLTDKEIAQVAKDSMRFTLNLNRANRAWWQKGVLSIPTQFWQVSTKFLENMVGGAFGIGKRKWTTSEKVKIGVGYMAMFGMAGTGLDGFMASAVQAYRDSTDDQKAMTVERLNPFNNLPPELRAMDDASFARFMRGGMVQALSKWMFGADVELTSRVSIPAGVMESAKMYTSGDRSFAAAVGGAAFASFDRSWQAIKGIYDIFATPYDEPLSKEEWRQALSEVAKGMSATTRNAEKSFWWHKVGHITDSHGRRIFDQMDDDEQASLELWQALGFQPAKIGWMYDLKESTEELKGGMKMEIIEGRVNERVRQAKEMFGRYLPDSKQEIGLTDNIDTLKKRRSMALRWNLMLEDLSDGEREQVHDAILKWMGESNARLPGILADAVEAETAAAGRVTAGSLANPLMHEYSQEK